jgi:hypothetical protein
MNGKVVALSLLLAGGMLVAGCGKTGELERPNPLWRASTNARTDATATGQQKSDNADQNTQAAGGVNRQSDVNRDMDPAPPRTLPIGGQSSNPGQTAPPGVLPDPYANPQ